MSGGLPGSTDWTTVLASGVLAALISALVSLVQQRRTAAAAAELERMKADLAGATAKKQRLEALQEPAIFALYGAFREAVYTAEHFAVNGQGFKNVDGHDAAFLIGEDWGKAYRTLNKEGILFHPALATTMRDVLGAIQRVEEAVRAGNAPYVFGELPAAGHERREAWVRASKVVSDELKPQWAAMTAELQRMLGLDVSLPQSSDKG